MPAPDPVYAQIAARFTRFDVTKTRGGYTLNDRRSGNPIARLRIVPKSDDFQLLYWSLTRESWRPFGPLGALEVGIDEAHEIIERESLFQLPRQSWISRLFR
jgi:hypothetical protein